MLGIPWTEIDSTPEVILDAAFDDWQALRAADATLAANRGM